MYISLHLSRLFPFFVLFRRATCSFYDNPEVELPPEGGTPLDELKAKWDSEVCETSCLFRANADDETSGPSLASALSPISDMSNA